MAAVDTATTSEMLAAARVDAGHEDAIESAEWMNQIVAQLWPFISTFIETTLKRDVEPLVNAQVPGWLGSITFGTVSLGATPLRIEGLDVIATGPAGTRLEADVHYDGDAQVSIDVVTNLLGTLSLGVQHVKLAGSIQFVMNPLVPVLPLMAATQLAFINRPTIAMDLTGLADVDRAASIKAIINNAIVDVLSGLLVLPNRVAAKVDPAADYFATYVAPAGVLRGTVAAGRDFQPQAGMFTTDQPDVYIIATLGDGTVTTPTVNNNVAPVWGTPFTFLVHNVRQALSLAAWEDDTAGDDALGVGAVAVADLAATADAWVPIAPAPTAEAPSPPIAGDVQLTGALAGLDVSAPLAAAGDGAGAAPVGLLVAMLDGATGLPAGTSASARLRLSGGSAGVVDKATASWAVTPEAPVAAWNTTWELLVGAADVESGVVAIDVLDGGSEGVGGVKLPLSSLTAAPSRTVQRDAWQLEGGSCSGSVRVKLFLYGFGA
ncbi:hypothetical protein BU14_0183s0045 [Porphyra umbilicalis]|uniref:Uncharacterized protein n=1 Tax=Porphyra umbilicalis TaxID=2786 RepID=A0A1X6P7Q6_PORUM|nr:hypothetical protein BU14_0183s0045 [Porphyra umbilicalis]|eukprot:OSX76653.1 hypothetical protein BU14_0183s0045 [Porphyra umbilicalis]